MKIKIGYLAVIFLAALVQGCFDKSGAKYCPDVEPAVNVDTYFFEQISQPIEFVGTSEHQLAIACHNCYDNFSEQVSDTYKYIESAIANNVDFIELDIVMSDDVGHAPFVSHENTSTGPLLKNVIENPLLINASQILFIEIKGQLDLKDNIRNFFNSLMAHQHTDGTYAYLNEQRFTVIRSIETDKTLRRFREVLDEDEYGEIRKYLKLSRLFYPKETTKMYNEIDQVHSCGFHMIELDSRVGIENIKLLSNYADTLGLAVNVYTLSDSNYFSFIDELKFYVDVVTVETRNIQETFSESLFQKVRLLLQGD